MANNNNNTDTVEVGGVQYSVVEGYTIVDSTQYKIGSGKAKITTNTYGGTSTSASNFEFTFPISSTYSVILLHSMGITYMYKDGNWIGNTTLEEFFKKPQKSLVSGMN